MPRTFCRFAFQPFVRGLSISTNLEPRQQESRVLCNPRPDGMRRIGPHSPPFFGVTASRPDHSLHRLDRPLDIELPTRLFSTIILDPLVVALIVLHDAIKLVSAGSLSDFTMMSTDSSPISRSHAISLLLIYSPVVFLGITVLSTAFVSLSLATKNANIFPSFSSPMNMQSK